MSQSEEDERCQVITEVAIQQAMDKCGSEEAVYNQLRRIVGLDPDDDPDCTEMLSEGTSENTLSSTRATRQWVMCRAWEMVEEDEMSLSAAVSKAWSEAKVAGEEMDIEV